MIRRLITVIAFLAAMPASASLHPGWSESGWQLDLSNAQQLAQKSNRPIFLYFDATWCSWCQQYKRDTLDKPAIQKKLKQHYIPLVIDYDAEPGLFKKLGGRGLPFTAILSPEGKLLNRFVGVLSETGLLAMLKQFRQQRTPTTVSTDTLFEPVRVSATNANAYEKFRRAFLKHVESLYSTEVKTMTGQYETGMTLKRPSPLTWMWLMQQPDWQQRAVTAAKVEAGHLQDTVAGGFFQYLHLRPTAPDYLESSKLLEVNAYLSQWFARAAKYDGKLLPVARSGVAYLLTTLKDNATGAFFQAQLADQVYYQQPVHLRRSPPEIDKVIRMDTNAQAIIALVDMSRQLDDAELLRHAMRAYEFLLTGMIKHERYYHLYADNSLQVSASLSDLLWLYAAGLELERMQENAKHRSRQIELARLLRTRIDQHILGKSSAYIEPELYGLIAWIATHPNRNLDKTEYFGKTQAHWAIKQMMLESETQPDTIIYGLIAWERLLHNK